MRYKNTDAVPIKEEGETKMPNELKPCPFCGGEARRYNGNYDFHGVVCKKCNAKVYGYDTQRKADNAWNRRANDEQAN